jgi:Carboxypeptidase regulatory-like domain
MSAARGVVASLVGMACLALGACGAGSTGARAMGGTAGSQGTGAAGSGAAGTGVLPTCQVAIIPISPTSFESLVAGPTSVMRVNGQITGPVSPLFVWKWTVSLVDGSPVPVSIVGRDPSLVEFPMLSVGTYTIAVELMDSACVGAKTITAAKPGGHIATFRLRVTPPSTQALPAQDLERQIIGGTPSGGNVLALDPGIVVGFDVVRAGTGAALPSYVRLTNVVSGAVLEVRTPAAGPSALRVAQGMYRTVVVPDGDVAPVTFASRSPAAIGAGPLPLDDGALVGGTVSDASGNPLSGATVVLRAGELVSTTGTTDATGAFHVRARAGTFGLTVVSTLAAGALESRLAAEGGLVIDEATPTPPLAIKLQPGALVTGTVALSANEPASLDTATRATLVAMAIADVGTVTIGGGAPRMLTGDVRFSLHPAADGTLSTGGVPRGVYRLTVFPSSATTSDGVTAAMLDLSLGNVGPLAVSLAQKVMLSGTLLPAAEAAGVRLVALDEGGLPIVSEANAGLGGAFQLAVSRNRSYALRALPRADQALARASFPVVTVTDAARGGLDLSMPAALLYSGRVVDPSLQGVGTALVQAFCETPAVGCDPTTPVAETVTRSDGTFQLMLPDPDGTP